MKQKKSIPSKIIYADPRRKTSWWSAMAHGDGSWVIFDDNANVSHRGSSRDQDKAVQDAIRWLRSKGKMA